VRVVISHAVLYAHHTVSTPPAYLLELMNAIACLVSAQVPGPNAAGAVRQGDRREGPRGALSGCHLL